MRWGHHLLQVQRQVHRDAKIGEMGMGVDEGRKDVSGYKGIVPRPLSNRLDQPILKTEVSRSETGLGEDEPRDILHRYGIARAIISNCLAGLTLRVLRNGFINHGHP